MSLRIPVRFLSIGKLHKEFIIDFQGRSHEDVIGGPCLYAAGVMRYYGGQVGVAGIIGKDFPPSWQHVLIQQKIDYRGIMQVENFPDQRVFHAYPTPPVNHQENPVAVYSSRELTFPKGLLGYSRQEMEDSWKVSAEFTNQLVKNLPFDYLDAAAAYLSALDFPSQVQLTTWLFKGSIRTVAVHSHPSYMLPGRFEEINLIVKDTTLFVTTLAELRQLFQGRSSDPWEMMSGMCDFGCSFTVVHSNSGNWMIYDSRRSARYIIPDYPAIQVDPTGAEDAFSGAFLVHYLQSHDPLQAALMAVVAVSLEVEGTGPFAIQHSTPGLDLKRAQMLQNLVARI